MQRNEKLRRTARLVIGGIVFLGFLSWFLDPSFVYDTQRLINPPEGCSNPGEAGDVVSLAGKQIVFIGPSSANIVQRILANDGSEAYFPGTQKVLARGIDGADTAKLAANVDWLLGGERDWDAVVALSLGRNDAEVARFQNWIDPFSLLGQEKSAERGVAGVISAVRVHVRPDTNIVVVPSFPAPDGNRWVNFGVSGVNTYLAVNAGHGYDVADTRGCESLFEYDDGMHVNQKSIRRFVLPKVISTLVKKFVSRSKP